MSATRREIPTSCCGAKYFRVLGEYLLHRGKILPGARQLRGSAKLIIFPEMCTELSLAFRLHPGLGNLLLPGRGTRFITTALLRHE